jgi:VWA domain-containing protein
MANREKTRLWPLAVTASLLLHGVVVLGLSLLPRPEATRIRAPSKPQPILFMLTDDDAGDMSFEEAQEPPARKEESSAKKTTSADAPTINSVLRDPLLPAPGDNVGPGDGDNRPAGPETPASVGTGEVSTSFFKVAARGRRIVYVVDGSGSMGKNGALKAACAELNASARRLPAQAQFQIIIYSSRPQFLLPRYPGWLEPTPDMLQTVSQALAGQSPEGKTEHGLALKQAFLLRPDVIFFLTDADDLKPEHLRLAAELNHGAVIHTIELNTQNRQRRDMPLQMLAQENHGTYQAVNLEPAP